MEPFKIAKLIIIISIFLVIAFVLSCSNTVLSTTVNETTQAPETTAAPSTTAIETTTTQEATTTTEAEIINAPEIAGLSFNQATKTYTAEANNPYGLEAGAEAGVYTKEAIKINGEMEDAVGLKPAVIDFFQKEMIKKNELLFPLIFDLNEAKGVEIKFLLRREEYREYWFGMNLLEGTKAKVFAPHSTKLAFYTKIPGGYFDLTFCSEMTNKERGPALGIQTRSQFACLEGKKEAEEPLGSDKHFEMEAGEIIADINENIPFSGTGLEGEHDLLFVIAGDSKDDVFEYFLTFDNKKIYILSDKEPVDEQKQS